MMTIGSVAGAGSMRPGSIGMGMQNDPASKNIQQQIANAQKKMQEVSSDKDLPLEEKMKKRQELQQEISNLNQQLRQHQTEQRRQQQAKQIGEAKAGSRGTGLSQAGMQAVLSADASMKQAHVQGSTVKQMQGRAGVLRAEIKQDAARGDTRKKEAELADLEQKTLAATASQMSSLANANQAAEEAAKAEQDSGSGKSEQKAKKAGKDQKGSRTENDSRGGKKADTVDENLTENVSAENDRRVRKTTAGEPVPSDKALETENAAPRAAGQMRIYTAVDIRL